ncbi:aldehyde dehydrogenase family protein [Furfurilactobacillus siliginis]|uniref:Aldehyde dehydrogenase n=1 Tax=Furfurilactobacillus siliginis TaxID=348151 RepID=A0A0R2L3F6_9LACO|nr:aldehyde dehydrogenase family protein [Furfurilactobacillus siliginis]KRN96227.1 aldehyde dehydrogenase EutE [Furfurilactobacillus siliginis]GEK27848.1 aldehyde dehydrogenase [Furfurilactobacillus siliginis]
MAELEEQIRKIIKEELGQQSGNDANVAPASSHTAGGHLGIFPNVEDAIAAAKAAEDRYVDASIETRNQILDAIKEGFRPYIEQMAKAIREETGMGTVQAKIAKLNNALYNTPGPEILQPEAETGDGGLIMYEYAPYGVIGAVGPSTNPSETVIANAIMMLAGGNTVFFGAHPGAKNITRWTIEKLNEFVEKATGWQNLVVGIENPSIEAVQTMMQHPDIALLAVTGGPAVVHQAMTSGKKAIGAGAGNPPAIVDATADIKLAAHNIIESASFDNDILCTAEKEVVVEQSVKDELIRDMQNENAFLVTNPADIQKLADMTITDKGTPDRKFVGKDATFILDQAGISYTGQPVEIILEAPKDHLLVVTENLMPILPIVSCPNFVSALRTAVEVEQGFHHTASIHSRDLIHINKAAHRMNTSIFVVNGPTFSGTGVGFTGASALTIATPTGEGTTTAKSFTRRRRLNSPQAFSLRSWND